MPKKDPTKNNSPTNYSKPSYNTVHTENCEKGIQKCCLAKNAKHIIQYSLSPDFNECTTTIDLPYDTVQCSFSSPYDISVHGMISEYF